MYQGRNESNMTFSQNNKLHKGVVSLQFLESPRFNEEKINIKANAFKNQATHNTGGCIQNDKEEKQGKYQHNIQTDRARDYKSSLSESLQRYKKIMNEVSDKQYEYQSNESTNNKTIGFKQAFTSEKTQQLSRNVKNQYQTSSNNEIKQNRTGKDKIDSSDRVEYSDVDESQNITDSAVNGVTQQLRKLREQDYFKETESEQSFEKELNSRLRFIEVQKKLLNDDQAIKMKELRCGNMNNDQQIKGNNLNSDRNNDKLSSCDQISARTNDILRVRRDNFEKQTNLRNFNNQGKGLEVGSLNSSMNSNYLKQEEVKATSGGKIMNKIQNKSLYQDLRDTMLIKDGNELSQSGQAIKQWEDHLNEFTNASERQRQFSSTEKSGVSSQITDLSNSKDIQSSARYQQECIQLENQDNQNLEDDQSLLRVSRLDASEQQIIYNQNNLNQNSLIGINSRFQNSTLHSRYSFLEQDQSQNSEKKNISRTIYNSARQNPSFVPKFNPTNILSDTPLASGRYHGGDMNQHQKSHSNENVSCILPDNIRDNNSYQSSSENNLIFLENNKNNNLYQSDNHADNLNESNFQMNEISHISGLDHLQNQLRQAEAMAGQEELSEYSQSALSNSETKIIPYMPQVQKQRPLVTLSQELDFSRNIQKTEMDGKFDARDSLVSNSSSVENSQSYRYPSKRSTKESNNIIRNDQQQVWQGELVRQFEDIMSDKETLSFLIKYFGNYCGEDIPFVYFLDALNEEFGETIGFSEDIEKIQFEEELQSKLTTTDADKLSLNALQIFTKESGLRERICNISLPFLNEKVQKFSAIRNDLKVREKDSLNNKIFSEIHSLSKILEKKSKEIARKERALMDREQELLQKEKNFKTILKGEFDVMILSLDEAIKERNQEVNKKSIQLERNLKAKLKIIETKAKEIKQHNSNSSSNSDKLKAKLASTEKQSEFLKLKAQDLERKFIIEQESNLTLTQKYDNLMKKFKDLDRQTKELEFYITSTHNNPIQNQEATEIPLSYSQSRTYSQFRQLQYETDAKRLKQQGHDLPSPIQVDSQDEDDQKIGEFTINEINSALQQNIGLNQWSIQPSEFRGGVSPAAIGMRKKKTSGVGAIVSQTGVATTSTLKKKTPIGPMGSSTTTDEEVKVLLAIVQTMMNNIKTTLPLVLNGRTDMNQDESMQILNESCIDMSIAVQRQSQIDLGEFFYPCYNNLVGSLVEIIPSLLVKQCNPKHLYGVVELMFTTISFKFRYNLHIQSIKMGKKRGKFIQHSMISDDVLESTRIIIKSGQDHVNEIMMNPKQPFELTFIPQTAFWKRKIKVIPKKTNSSNTTGNTARLQNTPLGFQLFSNEDVQKELLAVFKQYIDHSELLLKRKISPVDIAKQTQSGQVPQGGGLSFTIDLTEIQGGNTANQKSIVFENQKFILMTRICLQLMTLILQVQNKEGINSLSSLDLDTSNESESLNDFLINYMLNMGIVSILVWRMAQIKDDPIFIEKGVSLLVKMSLNASYKERLFSDISDDDTINKLILIFERYSNNHDIIESIVILIYKITYTNDQKDKYTPRQIKIFTQKLKEAENSKEDNGYLIANLRSIIQNIS